MLLHTGEGAAGHIPVDCKTAVQTVGDPADARCGLLSGPLVPERVVHEPVSPGATFEFANLINIKAPYSY